jgi:hypothetical protein
MSTNPRDVVAEGVYRAMQWAAARSEGRDAPAWIEGGNSHAQEEARRAADAILSTLQPAVTDEAVEAAAKALTQIIWEQSLETVMGRKVTASDLVTARAQAALTAALPFMMGERT